MAADKNAWMITFSDLVTLMITFFVMLLTMSSLDTSRLEKMFQYFPGAGTIMDGGRSDLNRPDLSVIEQMKMSSKLGEKRFLDEEDLEPYKALTKWLESNKLLKKAKMIRRKDSYEVHLENRLVFNKGSIAIRKEARPFLVEVAKTIKSVTGQRLRVQIISDNDSDFAAQTKYKDPWIFAAKRGNAIVDFLKRKQGVPGKRLSMMGYGAPRNIPVTDDQTESFDQRVELVFLMDEDDWQVH